MNELLVDSHVLLWILEAKPHIGKIAQLRIKEASKVFVSAASIWELRIKAGLGKLELPPDFEKAILHAGFLELPVYFHHSSILSQLETTHKDPFDRLLLATARSEGIALLTVDEKLRELPGTIDARL